ncbi:MAG: hypothetical protein R3263_13100, partial [Myxococcota bacterium]|nr:hypothetical protein [Myxococcota bacterium]
SGAWHGPPAKIRRLARAHGDLLAPPWRALLPPLADALEASDAASREAADARLRAAVERWEHTAVAWRLWGRFLALERSRLPEAAEAFGRAYALSGAPEDAYDAGRALGWSDPEAAWAWFARIPPAERDAWPRIAYFEALHALRRGASPAALRAHRERLLRFWDTPEGRGHPGVPQALADLSEALGEPAPARAFADAAARQREARARQLQGRIATALGAGETAQARTLLTELQALAPGHPATIQARTRVARATGSRRELAAVLAERRLWAPDLEGAIAEENQLRRDLGLPLLPPLEAEELARRARSVVGQTAAGPADSGSDADARPLLSKQPTAGS